MPKAKASKVAAASHGNTRSANARKRDGLARSITGIAGLLIALLLLIVLRNGGNVASLCYLPVWSLSRHSSGTLLEPLPQRDGGGKGADHRAHQAERAEHAERRAERHRPDDRR